MIRRWGRDCLNPFDIRAWVRTQLREAAANAAVLIPLISGLGFEHQASRQDQGRSLNPFDIRAWVRTVCLECPHGHESLNPFDIRAWVRTTDPAKVDAYES